MLESQVTILKELFPAFVEGVQNAKATTEPVLITSLEHYQGLDTAIVVWSLLYAYENGVDLVIKSNREHNGAKLPEDTKAIEGEVLNPAD